MSNPDGSSFWFNSRWHQYTGRSTEEMKQLGWKSVLHPTQSEDLINSWNESISSGRQFESIMSIKGADGNYRLFLSRVLPINNEKGEILRWFGTGTDVTELKKAEEALEIQNKELNKINNDLDNFIYTASHDLKAPISNIEGLIVTIPEIVSPEFSKIEEFQNVMGMINKSIDKFKITIQDLADVSRLQRVLSEEETEIIISEIFDDTRLSLSQEIEKSNTLIRKDFSDCPTIRFSRKNFRSVIYNLLSNAIKYRKPDISPVIEIKTKRTDEYIILTVKDNGLGIDPSKTSFIFGMFKRLHDHVEGTGVGLYMVRRIIDNAGGKIEVESEPGVGTSFHVYFPVSK